MLPQERTMQVMKYFFVVSCLAFILITIRVPSQAKRPPSHAFELIIAFIALANLALGFLARPLLARLAQANSSASGKATPQSQWISANLISLSIIESCALFAVVLHFVGSSHKLVGLIFACALLALFFWKPGTPPSSSIEM